MNRLTRCCKTYAKTNKLYPNPQFSQSISPHELAEEEEKELNDWETIKKEQTDWGTVTSSDTNFDSVEHVKDNSPIKENKTVFYPFFGWH